MHNSYFPIANQVPDFARKALAVYYFFLGSQYSSNFEKSASILSTSVSLKSIVL